MRRREASVLVRISAVIGLVACLGVFAAGLWRADAGGRASAGARQDDPIVQEMQRGMAAYRAGRWDDAIAAFGRVVEQRPEHAGAWFQLALSVHSKGEYADALEVHERAAGFARFRSVALYNLACAHARLGQTDEAFGALGEAIDAGFADAEHAGQDSDLESLRGDDRFASALARMHSPDETLLRFWVGDWDVYSAATGRRAGENSLTLRNNGMFILERWTDARGNTGESFNYFDSAEKTWRQVWADGNGVVEFAGTRRGAGVLFEGVRLAADPDDRRRVRMHVRPIEGGRVQQTGTRWDEDAQGWEPRYDLIYVPKGEAYEPGGDPAADI